MRATRLPVVRWRVRLAPTSGKRSLDLVLGCAGVVVSAPVVALLALLVRLESRGDPIYRQARVGKDGQLFSIYKLRTMVSGAEFTGAGLAITAGDARITRVGTFLRRTSLDELPQMFNILRGEMSWVGPRPPTPEEVAKYSEWDLKRLDVTPGLTGLWQVSGRSDLSFDEMVKLDIYYAENWSLAVDAVIILKTIPAVLKREGAY